ncbi:MAG: SurA N-terminal domain-containing protein, partial [Candidatus Portnoybacteria bacterium]|nr:SurA N-terminal domain-containing protein [Candidatus Portnoybacteria bacterium]
MLKKLSNKQFAKKIWIVLAILIVPAFVLWGFGNAFRSDKGSGYAGKLFGKKVTALEFQDAYAAVKNQAIIQLGDKFTELQQQINLQSQAWDWLILAHEAKKRKIKASDKEVAETIQSFPFFQRKGQFDNKTYAEMLQYVFRT